MKRILKLLVPAIFLTTLFVGLIPVWAQDVVSIAPISHWDFTQGEDPTILYDRENDFDGELQNFNTDKDWGTTEGKGILRFDGDDKFVLVEDRDDLTFSNGVKDVPLSVTTYLNTGVLSDQNVILSKFDEQSNQMEWVIEIVQRKVRFTLYSNSTNSNFIRKESTEELLENSWYHITATYNGNGNTNGIRLYLNGEEMITRASNRGSYEMMSNTPSNVLIGGFNNGTPGIEVGDFDGTMLDTKVFDQEIAFAQIESDIEETILSCTGEGFIPEWLCPIVYQFSDSERANNYVNSRIRLVLYVIFIVVLIAAIGYSAVAGIKYITSSGDQSKMDEAKEAVKAILFGFAAMILAVAGIFLVFLLLGGDPFAIPTELNIADV